MRSKADAIRMLNGLLVASKIRFCPDAKLKSQLISIKCRLQPSGGEIFPLNGLDRAALVVTAMHAAIDGHVKCSALPSSDAAWRAAFGSGMSGLDRSILGDEWDLSAPWRFDLD